MTAVPPPTDLAAWLTELETARAAGTPGPWATDERRPADVVNHKGFPVAYAVTTLDRDADAALIVAAVNAVGPLVQAVREFAELEAAYPLGSDVPVYRIGRILARLESTLTAAMTSEETTP